MILINDSLSIVLETRTMIIMLLYLFGRVCKKKKTYPTICFITILYPHNRDFSKCH